MLLSLIHENIIDNKEFRHLHRKKMHLNEKFHFSIFKLHALIRFLMEKLHKS